ncbi:MAG: hypothetical protein NTZ32_08060 [Planctomycetales bacterium]|nr:hypothetical protein [Planctomycetales bacterium]
MRCCLTSRSRPWIFSEFQSLARHHQFENEIDGGKAGAVAAAMKATMKPIGDGLIPPNPLGGKSVQDLNPLGGSPPSDSPQILVGLKLTLVGAPCPVMGVAALTTPRRGAALLAAATLEDREWERLVALGTGV